MASKVRNLSALIDKQLPNFISTEYPKFSAFLQKYYEQLELPGQPSDLINNLTKYRDIDTYESKIMKESTTLSANLQPSATTITVADTSSFPKTNGYVLINDEAIFYKSKTNTTFVDCYRNINATTKLGDLYNKPEIKTVPYNKLGQGKSHSSGSTVLNISNLFLYSLVKNFEKEYLGSFPERDLKSEVDKTLLIKNIKKFYSAKGTDQSIKFLFNSIVAKEASDVPSIYYPSESTYKSSSGEWIDKYALKVKILSGDVTKLLGEKIVQEQSLSDSSIKYSFAIVDNILDIGDGFYELILGQDTVVGEFSVPASSYLTKTLLSSDSSNKNINVYSTSGWNTQSGSVVIGTERISFKSKSVRQFTIESRGNTPLTYPVNTPVYDYVNVYGEYVDTNGVSQKVYILIQGILYNLRTDSPQPYSKKGDKIQISNSGFETRDTIIFDKLNNDVRWALNENNAVPTSASSVVQNGLSEVLSEVSAIYSDDQYYYITSSGYPAHSFGNSNWSQVLSDQKHLKLIRKSPTRTTEVYKTLPNEVGILVNGTTVRSYKDTDENKVVFGEITQITVTKQGSGYKKAPYVLIQDGAGDFVATAKAYLNGEVVERIEVLNSGENFFPPVPSVTITSGRNAVVQAVVTGDKVTNLKIVNPGEYYSTPPKVVIKDSKGNGRFASYTAVINDDGKITGFIKNDEGKFYTQENISVEIIPEGSGAEAVSVVKSWRKNLLTKHAGNLDSNNGYYFLNNDISLGYGYSYLANPKMLRVSLGDNLDNLDNVPATLTHSPILGYAYDGNPIYGPYGYSNPLNPSSAISRMTSSYALKNSRVGGPPLSQYPLGTFIEDYAYVHRSGLLDENNGRFCVTPDYPEGTYAYFITITSNNTPVFPYIVGDNFYSLPVDSNYNKQIWQKDLPKNIQRLRTDSTPSDGSEVFAYIDDVKSGTLSNITVESSTPTFSVGGIVELDYAGTDGSNALAKVSSVKGVPVTSIESQQTKAIKIVTENSAYFFQGDTITQESTGASGQVIGNVFDDKTIVLRNVSGTFNSTNNIYSTINVINVVTDKSSDYTANSNIVLTNGKQVVIIKVASNRLQVASNPFVAGEPIVFSNSFSGIVAGQIYYVSDPQPTTFKVSSTPSGSSLTLTATNSPAAVATSEKARGIILESTTNRNLVKIKVLQGTFSIDQNYYLRSLSLDDTIGSKIVTIFNLSSAIKPLSINDNIAIVSTFSAHKIGQGEKVNVDIIPNDSVTETTIYVRSRIYQKVKLSSPVFNKIIKDTGVGRVFLLDNGSYKNNLGNIVGDYASSTSGNATFTNVELVFADINKCRDAEGRIVGNSALAVVGKPGNANNARATVSITNGVVTNVVITTKGVGYKRGDILTVSNASLNRSSISTSTRFLIMEVQHVGFGSQETRLYLNNVELISVDDYLKIDNEVLRVTSVNVNNSYVDVLRARENTVAVDHYNNQPVTSYKETFKLTNNFQVGNQSGDGYVFSYDREKQELTVVYEVGNTLATIKSLTSGSAFFDQSVPKKLVTIQDNLESSSYKFEFSYDNTNWVRNPILELQKYYKYKFDTSHYTLRDSFLEFSPSGNFNILTTEITKNNLLPGTAGSFLTLKIGFGSSIQSNTYTNKKNIDFNNYFYFDKNKIIDSEKSYVRIIEDPLQGEKTVVYVTPTKFVYEMGRKPKYDGSGNISYTTTSSLAVGEVDKIQIFNQGIGFTDLPVISGIRPAPENECLVNVNWNSTLKNISSIEILNPGKNYSKPKLVLVNANGKYASFDVIKDNNGSIIGIITKNKGENYTFKPEAKIIETDVKAYVSSNNIGLPQSVTIVFNGKNFGADRSLRKQFSGSRILVLKNISQGTFLDNEEISQYDGNTLIAKGYVSNNGWKSNSNVLRVERIQGQFRENLQVVGKFQGKTGLVTSTFATIFSPEIKSYYDNLGYYASDRGKLSSNYQKLADSYFYQDYSYVIKSRTPIDLWRDLIKQTVHPAGFKVFGELSIESQGQNRINSTQPNINHVSIVQLWDPQKNKVTVENTHRVLTQSTFNLSNLNVVRGRGSVFASSFDTGEMVSYDIKLTPDFNGYFDANGNRAGNKTFTITLRGSNTPYSVDNVNNILLSLDGIYQEPGKAFTVSGTQLTFAEAPLGYRSVSGQPISYASYKEGVDTPSQKIVGRILRFKDSGLNNQYFRKIKNISSQFDGVKKSFDLYYEDNTPVQLQANENLLVAIDGVVQQSGSTPLLPLDRSYYIRRTVTPNQIVFVEAPRNYTDIKQSFFGISISGYERLLVESRYINGVSVGPFILRSAVSGKTVTVDEDRNVLVFIDGVFQQRLKNYTINGSNITFKEPLRVGQKVNILYVYGRDYQKALNAFNFESSLFFNRFVITISGSETFGNYPIELDGATIKSNTTQAIIKKVFFNGTNTEITVDSQNTRFLNTEDLIIIFANSATGENYTIPANRIVSIQSFEENEDRQDLLRKSVPGWLLTNQPRFRKDDFIDIGDLIKIDGEKEYRQILQKPDIVVKTSYRNSDDVNSNYFGKLGTSNYNDIVLGEGLDVIANIENGKVVSLSWNKKDWNLFETKQIYPSSPGYGYETAPQLVFVAQAQKDEGGTIIAPAQGGGAKAYAVVHDGEVVDIVLYDQGSDYLVAPKVYVSRGYDLIRKNRSIDVSQILVSMSPLIASGGTLYISSGASLDSSPQPPILTISTFVVVSPVDSERKITSIVQKVETVIIPDQKALKVHTSILNVQANVSSISVVSSLFTTNFETPFLTVTTQNNTTVNNSTTELTSGVRAFLPVTYLRAYPLLYETGAYLDIPLSSTDNIVYIPTTSKFKISGKLLIEDEIVSYSSKLSDRFIGVTRGIDGTTAKIHNAGAFLRQYSEDVTLVSAGAVSAGTSISITNINASVSGATVNITSITQNVIEPQVVDSTNEILDIISIKTEVTVNAPVKLEHLYITQSGVDISLSESRVTKSITTTISTSFDTLPVVDIQKLIYAITLFNDTGFADGYTELVVLDNIVRQRNGNIVTLEIPYNEIIQRNSNIVLVNNAPISSDYSKQYKKASLSNTLSKYNSWYNMNVGSANVSALSFSEIEVNYSYLTIADFDLNNESSFTLSRDVWNLGYSSIQNPIANVSASSVDTSQTNFTITTTNQLNYFPSSGYLYIGHSEENFGVLYAGRWAIISYTGKSGTSFTGCNLVTRRQQVGDDIILQNAKIIPYSV